MRRIRKRCDARRLGDAPKAEVIADLVELVDQCGLADRVTHTDTGQPIGLGKGTKPQYPAIRRIDWGHHTLRGKFAIGFVKYQQGL